MDRSKTYINDLNFQKCRIIDEVVRQDLIDAGVVPTSTMYIVQNEDGSKDQLFPWELTSPEEELDLG